MPDYAASVQAVGLRATKLDTTGAPAVGAAKAYTTRAFTRFSWTPEYVEGEEIETIAADGTQCVYFKMPDTLKRVTWELEICAPSPELSEMIAGGTILTGTVGTAATITNKALTSNVATLTTAANHNLSVGDTVVVAGVDATFNGSYIVTTVGSTTTFSYAKTAANVTATAATGTATKGDNTGWAAPAAGVIPTPNGIALEVWSRAIVGGKPAVLNPYWRWVIPYAQGKLEGDRTLENGALATVFSGYGLGNTAFGDGPANDWLQPSASAIQYARDTGYASTEGYFTVLA